MACPLGVRLAPRALRPLWRLNSVYWAQACKRPRHVLKMRALVTLTGGEASRLRASKDEAVELRMHVHEGGHVQLYPHMRCTCRRVPKELANAP